MPWPTSWLSNLIDSPMSLSDSLTLLFSSSSSSSSLSLSPPTTNKPHYLYDPYYDRNIHNHNNGLVSIKQCYNVEYKPNTNHRRRRHHSTANNNVNEYLNIFIWSLLIIILLQFNLCDCLVQTQASTGPFMERKSSTDDDNLLDPVMITNSKLANIRFVRSYSEEFTSSSEERERSLQFFGGTSAGGGGSSSSVSANKRISPYFETESISTNVTISEGSSFVHLPCRVKQLGDRTLSWIRRQDVQILTVGTFTYIPDQRFQAIHRENSDDWSLQISYPRKKDAGLYECQISTIPKMSIFIRLNVIVSRAKIVEGPTLYISSGSTLNLTCVVKDTPEPPDYIFWYYNGEVINYGLPRGIKVETDKSAQTVSKLTISKAQANDSGNYSCTPSNAEPAHIAVHIQNNANPAASIQHGKRSASREYGSNNAMILNTNRMLTQLSFLIAMLLYININ